MSSAEHMKIADEVLPIGYAETKELFWQKQDNAMH